VSFTLRAKRVLIGAAAGAMVLGLLPAGAASAGTAEVCANAPDAGFSDVTATGTHTENINCMAAYGVGRGLADGSYGVFQNLTRGQAASLFVAFATTANPGITVPAGSVPFTDIATNTHRANIEILYRLGLIQGTTATTFSPNASITRGQFATILRNAHQALGVTFPANPANPFTDISGSVHATAIVQLAAAGVVNGLTPTTYGPSQTVRRGQTASALALSAGVLDDAGLWAAPRLPAPGLTIPGAGNLTAAPELVSVSRVGTDVLRYNFDMPVPGVAANTANFRLYAVNWTWVNPTEISIDGSSVVTRYTQAQLGSAVKATSRAGAVASATGVLSLTSDVGMQATATPVSPTPAYSPDLISVGNYRYNSVVLGGNQYVLVDFTFNSQTGLTANNITNFNQFHLVGVEGQQWQGLANAAVDFTFASTQTTTGTGEAGTLTISVPFAVNVTEVPQGQLRRGWVLTERPAGDALVLSSNFGTTGGVTVDPDLVSVTREGDTNVFRFTFDEAVSGLAADLSAGDFWLFQNDGVSHQATVVARSAIAEDGARVVRAQFPTLAAAVPVKGAVTDSAVRATDSTDSDNAGYNRAAAANITIPAPPAAVPPLLGRTDLPDLVSVQKTQNIVTGTWRVTFTFDQAPAGLSPANVNWDLYDAAGTRFSVSTAANVGTDVVVTGNSVTIFAGGTSGLSNDQIAATVAASVQTVNLAPPALTPEGRVAVISATS
jgi:hypothetical protein